MHFLGVGVPGLCRRSGRSQSKDNIVINKRKTDKN